MSQYQIIDELFEEGYALNLEGDCVGGCEKWLQAWDMIKALFAEGIAEDIFDLNSKYKWRQYPSNYVQDLEMELHNAGIDDKTYHLKRIEFCQELLRWCGTDDELLISNTRIAIAQAHYEIGDESAGEQLFKEWVREDPDCGWAYCGWSDSCRYDGSGIGNEKAEKILLAGYEKSGLRDSKYVVERLITLYEEMGKPEKVKEFKKIYAPFQRAELKSTPHSSTPAKSEKIGRNTPCPCGSGKKYKKCCGA